MTILAVLTALDAILHGALIYRFGVKGNEPFAIFTVVNVLLTLALYFAVPYAVWATLVLSAIGLIGFTITFNKVARDKSLEYVIWIVDAAVVVYAAYLLFFAGAAPAPAA
ncbi:MAG TPA: hypothetical protein VHA70_04565 [Bauldia sp.]|nr:hypothetical protein [Bauldia sp.]